MRTKGRATGDHGYDNAGWIFDGSGRVLIAVLSKWTLEVATDQMTRRRRGRRIVVPGLRTLSGSIKGERLVDLRTLRKLDHGLVTICLRSGYDLVAMGPAYLDAVLDVPRRHIGAHYMAAGPWLCEPKGHDAD